MYTLMWHTHPYTHTKFWHLVTGPTLFRVVIHVHTHLAYTPLHPQKILTFGNWTHTNTLNNCFSLSSFTLSSQTIRCRTHHPPPSLSTLLSLPSFSSPPFSLLHPFSPLPLTEHHHRPRLTSTGNTPKLTTTASPLLFRRRWWKRRSPIHLSRSGLPPSYSLHCRRRRLRQLLYLRPPLTSSPLSHQPPTTTITIILFSGLLFLKLPDPLSSSPPFRFIACTTGGKGREKVERE